MSTSASSGSSDSRSTWYCRATISRATGGDRFQLFGNIQSGRVVNHRIALVLQFQASDANHHELVQVRVGNGQKLGPFQKRNRSVRCLVQNPLVEFKPAQLSVDESVGRQFRFGLLDLFLNG